MDNDVSVAVETSVRYPFPHQIFVHNVKLRVPTITHARVQANVNLEEQLIYLFFDAYTLLIN